MGLLSLITNQTESTPQLERVKQLRLDITAMEGQLRLDWTRRVYGDGTYSGYNVLRDFYKGRQWSFKKDGGGTMRTYNYCFTTVENLTAFMTNEPPQMTCPADDVSNAISRSLAEGRTKLLQHIHDENDLSIVFQKGARVGSICGDTFIFGSIPTFKVNDAGEKTFDSIRYWNIERPENIRPIWKDENYSELEGFVKWYRIELETAKRLLAIEMRDNKITLVADQGVETYTDNREKQTDIPMVTLKEYWTDTEYLLMQGKDNSPIHYLKHDWGFVPIHHIPNIHLPGEPRGTSDLENELDPQQEYNERASDLADIIKEIARPAYWGKNLDNLTEVRSGQTVVYQVGDDGEINAMPKSGQTMPIEQYLNDRKNDIIGLSGQNQVLYPGNQVLQATGRALSVIMQGVNNKVSLRKEFWVKAFKNLNKTILFHAENHIKDADKLIGGNYRTDVFISSVLVRSVSDEINKFQSKLQSMTTTMKNIGISSPSEEQKLMKEELSDEVLATEIAKQPGLLHQILAQRIGEMNGAGGMSAVGMAGINPASPANVASESDNAPGNQPAPGQSPAVSPAGRVAMEAARHGAPPKVAAKK